MAHSAPQEHRRLATWIPAAADKRLRLAHAALRRPMSEIITDAIFTAFPDASALAAILTGDDDPAATS
jgi:hypothetical protein